MLGESLNENTMIINEKIVGLTDQQLKSYIDDGYLVVPDLISMDELQELKTEITDIVRRQKLNLGGNQNNEELTDSEISQRILAINSPHYVSKIIHGMIEHPKVCSVLSQVVSAHLTHGTGNVKCMYSILFNKPPEFQGQAWHQDESYIPSRDRSLTAANIAIDDATIENGCLWVVPGSHKSGYMYPVAPHGQMDEYDFNDESYDFDDSEKIAVEMKAGSVVFFNGYLLHKSFKNRSNVYRRSLVTHYMSSESLSPWMGAETGEPVARADNRRIVHVAGTDPYIWKGYEELGTDTAIRMCSAALQKTKQQ